MRERKGARERVRGGHVEDLSYRVLAETGDARLGKMALEVAAVQIAQPEPSKNGEDVEVEIILT